MESAERTPTSRTQIWAGCILSGLPTLFLLFDSGVLLFESALFWGHPLLLGYSPSFILGIGVLELAFLILYAFPPTSVLGAVLLTGFLGGVIANDLRIGSPLFSHPGFPMCAALLIWAGLYLREDRLRALIPVRWP